MIRKLRYMAFGALLTYFFDPQNGRRRRALAGQRIPAVFRKASKKAGDVGDAATAQASAMKQKATTAPTAVKCGEAARPMAATASSG